MKRYLKYVGKSKQELIVTWATHSSEGGEKCFDFGYILKVKLTCLVGGLDQTKNMKKWQCQK